MSRNGIPDISEALQDEQAVAVQRVALVAAQLAGGGPAPVAPVVELVGVQDLRQDFKPVGKSRAGAVEQRAAVGRLQADRVCTVPATELALKYVKRPVPNAALLGAFAAISGRITLDAVKAAITEKFPGKVGEGNIAAATAAYEAVKAN